MLARVNSQHNTICVSNYVIQDLIRHQNGYRAKYLTHKASKLDRSPIGFSYTVEHYMDQFFEECAVTHYAPLCVSEH